MPENEEPADIGPVTDEGGAIAAGEAVDIQQLQGLAAAWGASLREESPKRRPPSSRPKPARHSGQSAPAGGAVSIAVEAVPSAPVEVPVEVVSAALAAETTAVSPAVPSTASSAVPTPATVAAATSASSPATGRQPRPSDQSSRSRKQRIADLVGRPVHGQVQRFLTDAAKVRYGVVVKLDGTLGLISGGRLGSLDLAALNIGDQLDSVAVGVNDDLRLRLSYERWEQLQAALALQLGDKVTGTVISKESYGAFLQLPGCRALLPLGGVAALDAVQFIDELQVGSSLTGTVSRVDGATGDVAITLRALAREQFYTNPPEKGTQYDGAIIKVVPYGIMVDIGFEAGLVHVSEFEGDRAERDRHLEELKHLLVSRRSPGSSARPEPVFIKVKLLSVDRERQQLALTMR